MKLIKIALKEVNLVKNRKSGFLLIILIPLLVIGSLGFAFGGKTEFEKIDVAIVFPKATNSFDPEPLVSKFKEQKRLRLFLFDSEKELIDSIKKGKTNLGLLIEQPSSQFSQVKINFYSDNTNLTASKFFYDIVNNAIEKISFQTSVGILSDLWSNFSSYVKDLDSQLLKIQEVQSNLESVTQRLIDLNSNLGELNAADLNNALSNATSTIEGIESKVSYQQDFLERLSEISSQLSGIKQEFSGMKTVLNSSISDIRLIKGNLNNQITAIASLKTSAQELIADPKVQASGTAVQKLISLQNGLISLETSLKKTSNDMDFVISDLTRVISKIEISETALADTSNELSQTIFFLKAKNAEIALEIKKSKEQLSAFNSQLSNSVETMKQRIQMVVQNAMQVRETTLSDLDESKNLFSTLIDSLSSMKKFSPEFVVNPIQVSQNYVYNIKHISILTPISISIVLILTTFLLASSSVIIEKKQGAMLRMKLSLASKTEIFFGKILGQLFFALIASFIILGIAMLFFGVIIAGNALEIIVSLMVISFAFICYGLFLTNFAKNESTAILSALLIIIPLIFLSGAVLPIELMSGLIKAISLAMPLTLSNTILLGTIIKGLSIANFLPQLMALFITGIIALAYTIMKE